MHACDEYGDHKMIIQDVLKDSPESCVYACGNDIFWPSRFKIKVENMLINSNGGV